MSVLRHGKIEHFRCPAKSQLNPLDLLLFDHAFDHWGND